ncbi:MAG: DUF1972 domain-containing protein [Parcubacteria group bacterium]|jgi:glycosyltransferase involved in cell wall biosynthesis
MIIAILGTRGIPNNYGGFEQFAEYLSVGLVRRGHSVIVYNPHFHDYVDCQYQGVSIVKQWCPENLLGASTHFIYDFLCLRDATNKGVDVVLECGYQSASPSMVLIRSRNTAIVTNMDGLEWKRDKWGWFTKKITLITEKLAVKLSDVLVADNVGIAQYLYNTYGVDSVTIPYGANVPQTIDAATPISYGLQPQAYFLLIARLEPENNIETILRGYLSSSSAYPFCIVGNHETKYGAILKSRYSDARIRFLGGIYNHSVLDGLRYGASIYFHGHSVGGTNPSLLEAMACQSFICAHDNEFNRSVLGEDALYFSSPEGVVRAIDDVEKNGLLRSGFIESNLVKIQTDYTWDKIVNDYEKMFENTVKERL